MNRVKQLEKELDQLLSYDLSTAHIEAELQAIQEATRMASERNRRSGRTKERREIGLHQGESILYIAYP